MPDPEQHLIQKLRELVPYDYDEVLLGSLGFNIHYASRGKAANPLKIDIQQNFEVCKMTKEVSIICGEIFKSQEKK